MPSGKECASCWFGIYLMAAEGYFLFEVAGPLELLRQWRRVTIMLTGTNYVQKCICETLHEFRNEGEFLFAWLHALQIRIITRTCTLFKVGSVPIEISSNKQ